MGVIVEFNYGKWALQFPMFGNISEQQVMGSILPLAEQYVRNDGGGPVCTEALQTQLLNLMVAHIAQLLYGANGQPASPVVGRINSATEGSVSIGSEWPTTPNNAWFLQTPYGAMFWQLALPFRLGRYRAKITQQYQPVAGPWPGYVARRR